MKKIPIGIDDFSKLVDKTKNFLFVDKTLMIKELLDSGAEVSLIVRPRRWGKTLNMSMLRYFLASEVNGSSTVGLFRDLQIQDVNNGYYINEYQGKYPVIFISFKDVKEKNYEDFINKINALIQNTCNSYPELEKSEKLTDIDKNNLQKLKGLNPSNKANIIDIRDSLKTLSHLLFVHYGQKVFILIDEYDAPLNAAYGKDYFEDLVSFFKGMFGAALKGNDALERGVMTGILRLSKNKMLSDINNLKLYSLMEEQYSHCFGFSEEEVISLFKENQVHLNMKDVQFWYNGYHAGDSENIYNPWSVLNCLDDKGKLKPYWIKAGDEDLLKKVLLDSSKSIKEKLNLLLTGHSIESFIDEYLSFDQLKQGDDEILWSLLWSLGYLKTIGKPQLSGTRYRYRVKIPNYEIECSYRDVFQTFIRSLNNTQTYNSFMNHLVSGEMDAFMKELQNYMINIPSWFDFPKESNYHTFLLGLISTLKETHEIFSNREFGLGRPDILLVPRDTSNTLAILMEFKKDENGKEIQQYEKLCSAGLNQMQIKQYDSYIKQESHIKKILKVCIVFFDKRFVCKSETTML